LVMDYTPPYILVGSEANFNQRLEQLLGETVCVSWVTDPKQLRNNFDYTQISVQGKLEGSGDTGRYRVVVDDNSYTYFDPDSVWCLSQNVDKRPVIFIEHERLVEDLQLLIIDHLTKGKDHPNVHTE